MNVVADVGDEMAERITAKDCGSNPEGAADSIEEHIANIRHFCSAGDRWTKRSNNGDEASENHGAATVFFVEVVGALKVATAKKEGILAAVKGSPGGTANQVTDLVAGDSTKHDGEEEPFEGDNSSVGEDASSDQKRITWKKKPDKEAGFNKDDDANEGSAARTD